MPTGPTIRFTEQFRKAVLGGLTGLGDDVLLGRFIEHNDEAAFAALIERHGAMIWGVCRRLLSYHAAEDAFQAAVLVFVRKAASVTPRGMVGNWLYGVAYQTALQARRALVRRGAREIQMARLPDAVTVSQDQWADVRSVLDEELSRLPDIYRAVVVLCDLEDRSRKDVARQLRVPEGTVGGRLARARALLAKRLNQRGVTLSVLAALQSARSVSASAPPVLVVSTIKAANRLMAGRGADISIRVATLTEGVLKAMYVTKIKSALAAVLVVGLALGGLGASTGLFTNPVASAQWSGEQPVAAREPDEKQPMDKAEDTFPGEWEWADGQKGGFVRIAITNAKGDWNIQAWGVAGGEEVDLGKTNLALLLDYSFNANEANMRNKYGFAIWDHKFAKSHATMWVENGRLVVEVNTIFEDKSSRPNYRSRYEFKKK